MWISIALGSGALAVVAAVPLLFVVCRDCLTPSARSRHRRALCAHGRALFDRAAKAVDPLTTWGYRHRGALALQRSGVARAEALRQLSDRVDLPAIRQLVTTLAQGERVGLSLTRILGDFARHERARRMMAAEKQAMRAPVKMLVPLSLCNFPSTFLIQGFPVLVIVTDLSP